MSGGASEKIERQIDKARLPRGGSIPYEPKLTTNRQGETEIEKMRVTCGPKKGKKGYVDIHGRIWVRDRAHANAPEHWDVQIDGGQKYIKVGLDGNELSRS